MIFFFLFLSRGVGIGLGVQSRFVVVINIFVNNPDQIIASGNVISDISDHFSQFCIAKQ